MLSKISQAEEGNYPVISPIWGIWEENELIDTSYQRWRLGMGDINKGGQKVQTPSCKISPGDVMYSVGTTVNNTVWQEQVTKASSLEASDEGN